MVQYSTRSNLKGSGTVNSTSAMSTDEPPADPYNYSADRGTQFVSLFFLIFLVLLFLLCIYCFCRWCGRRRRRRQRRAAALISILSGGADAQLHELQNVDAGLESSVIASLPTFTRQKQSCCSQDSDRPEVALECAVCLSAIGEGEVGRLLPNCGHVFHVECIDVWLGVNSTCPVCRREVVPVKEVAPAAGTVHADHLGSSETTTSSTSGSRLRPDELLDVVGDASGDEPANADGAVMTKEIGSTSRSATSFRKMVDRDSSEPRRLAPGVGEDDVERHIYMI